MSAVIDAPGIPLSAIAAALLARGTVGIEAIVSILALREGVLPPTINYSTPDPECDLDYTPNTARDIQVEYALSNNLGFGGHNASLIFKRFGG